MYPMATTDPTNMTPLEIDTLLSDNYEQRFKLHFNIRAEEAELMRHQDRIDRNPDRDHSYARTQIEEIQAQLTNMHVKYADLVEAAMPLMAEYDRRPWNRYFLVKNANGHVHRGTDCTTCFRDTQYGWLVELADCDESAMVEEWGERACTVCFPDAPTNPLYHRPARIDREAQEAKAAEKAAKAAAKAEKAITDVDGSELRVDGETFRTKVAARNGLSQAIQNSVWYGSRNGQYATDALHLARALEAAGVDWLPAAERAFKKAVKEAKPDPANPFRLTEEQIAETQREIALNIKLTEAAMEVLREI